LRCYFCKKKTATALARAKESTSERQPQFFDNALHTSLHTSNERTARSLPRNASDIKHHALKRIRTQHTRTHARTRVLSFNHHYSAETKRELRENDKEEEEQELLGEKANDDVEIKAIATHILSRNK